MQYILSEEEMREIREERLAVQRMGGALMLKEGLKNVCQHVACKMTETGGNLPNGRKPSDQPHGCIHVNRGYGIGQAMYCDDCPVAGICPQEKDYSK